jgi:hypothetical protein
MISPKVRRGVSSVTTVYGLHAVNNNAWYGPYCPPLILPPARVHICGHGDTFRRRLRRNIPQSVFQVWTDSAGLT